MCSIGNVVKKSDLIQDAGNFGAPFTNWVILETLHTIDGYLLYNLGKRELFITYTANFEVLEQLKISSVCIKIMKNFHKTGVGYEKI